MNEVQSSEGAEPQAPKKRRRERSPAYPGIDLEQAIDRARALYDAEKKHPASVDTILADWGYSPGSGRGLVTLAALKQFGLLSDEGSGDRRQGKLSDLALRILLDSREDSPQRGAAVREAALTPKIHRELWDRYSGSLPSDGNLRTYLQMERSFTDRAVRNFIPQFGRTVAFAGLDEASPGDDDPAAFDADPSVVDPPGLRADRHLPRTDQQRPNFASQEPGLRTVTLPLSGTAWVSIQGPFPLNERSWDQMIAMLSAMKPGLIASSETVQSDDDDSSLS